MKKEIETKFKESEARERAARLTRGILRVLDPLLAAGRISEQGAITLLLCARAVLADTEPIADHLELFDAIGDVCIAHTGYCSTQPQYTKQEAIEHARANFSEWSVSAAGKVRFR